VPVSTSARSAPITDAVVVAVGRLVDDAQVDPKRDPSHSELTFLFQQTGLAEANLTTAAGKKRRVRQVLNWGLEHDEGRGAELVARLIATVRACGGFRPVSPNFVGEDSIKNAQAAFSAEGFQLADDGKLRPTLLRGVEDPAWSYPF
jgi:hypothetical protein